MAPDSVWLRSERLDFMRPRPDDAADVMRLFPHRFGQSGESFACELLAAWSQHWHQYGFGYAMLRCRGEAGKRAAGVAGLKWQTMDGRRVLNLYYRLASELQGRGLAVEAVRELVGWAVEHSPGVQVVARIDATNTVSRRVAEGAGLRSLEFVDPAYPEPHQLFGAHGATPRSL